MNDTVDQDRAQQNLSQENNSDEVAQCQQELLEWKDKYIRIVSDFDNYKRRIIKEQSSWTTESQSAILADLLPIMDNFDRALEHENQSAGIDHDTIRSGLSLMREALIKILKKYSVKEMENYTHFDPAFHLAIAQAASDTAVSGDIIAVHEKGYTINNRVLREAKVTVAQ